MKISGALKYKWLNLKTKLQKQFILLIDLYNQLKYCAAYKNLGS